MTHYPGVLFDYQLLDEPTSLHNADPKLAPWINNVINLMEKTKKGILASPI